MDDIIGRIFSSLMIVFAIVYMPLMNITLKQDNTSQASIESAIVEFVDNTRATGKITSAEYEKMCNTIDIFQEMCEVKIEHSSKMVSYDTAKDESVEYYADYNKDDILEVIYKSNATENVPYKLRNGDYIKVTVYNTKPTLATKIYRLVMPMYNPSDVSIYATYGGLVGNNMEK